VKIKLGSPEKGVFVIVLALIVAVVVIVGIGGCVAGKCIANAEKFKAKRDAQLTNEVDSFSVEMFNDYVKRTGDTNARMTVSLSEVYVPTTDGIADSVLQWSTDLVTWNDYEGVEALTGDMITEVARRPDAPPMMFWRVKVY